MGDVLGVYVMEAEVLAVDVMALIRDRCGINV